MWNKETTCCTSFNSLSILPYISSYFSPYLYNMSLKSSSIASWTRMISSLVSVVSNWGLLAHVFFLVEGFFGEIFLFYIVIVPIGGSSSGGVVDLPPPFPSSPSSSPPPGKPDQLYSKPLSSTSLCISWTSSYFFFFIIPLECLACSSWVTMELPMVLVSDISTSTIGTRNSFGHSFVICSISSSIIL